MRQSRQSSSLAVAFATVPRRRAGRDALPASAASDGHWIRLRLAVASAQVFMLRQTLHVAIGKLARVYVVERAGRDAAMHAIMTALPAAEFGITTMLGSDHAAH
jgi:hypothetical protein